MYEQLKQKQENLIHQKNRVDENFYNGIYSRYAFPVLTRDHVPIEWRYDVSIKTNPHFMERLMVNATFNSGAIFLNNTYYLVCRLEGADRKSIFALASSPTGIDQFRFERLLNWDDLDPEETNRYDMRLVQHEDGYIYGIYCAEKKDRNTKDTEAALADVGLVRTKDLIHWTKLPNLKTPASQQRNVVLHPEFDKGRYVFYTRPQDGFIEVGSGGGIYLGYVDNILDPKIEKEYLIQSKVYHTIYEYKNGQGPQPIKTPKGWIHLAHGVRNTADGLRYVLYMFATDLTDLTKIIARPSGYLIAPLKDERTGDVSNVVFSNGWIVNGNNVYIYYASSDTRMHVATSTIDQLMDYVFNTPHEVYRSNDSTKQRQQLIDQNMTYLKEK